ncbi:MAG: EMC3/TMCO1 family protein [Nanoarchaeota archaeon]|nr:EMC3/TMCO1 family protein [Nanoarchaeota archaeon]
MKNKEGSFRVIMIVMFVTMLIAINWDKWEGVKNAVHSVLDPTLGALLTWDLGIGMLLIMLVLSFVMTLIQKYTTNQTELKSIRKQQKDIQKEMKKLQKENPKKAMALQKESMPLMGKQMKLGMRSIVYTGIPIVLLYRWFYDFFLALGTKQIWGINWILFYLIAIMVFSSIIKKKMDIV